MIFTQRITYKMKNITKILLPVLLLQSCQTDVPLGLTIDSSIIIYHSINLDTSSIENNATLTVEDTSIAEIKGNKIYGKKIGKTNVVLTYKNNIKKYEIEIKNPAILDEVIGINNNFTLRGTISTDSETSYQISVLVYAEGYYATLSQSQDNLLVNDIYYVDEHSYIVEEIDEDYYYHVSGLNEAAWSATEIKNSLNLKKQFETLTWKLKETKINNNKVTDIFTTTDDFQFYLGNNDSEAASINVTFTDGKLTNLYISYIDDSYVDYEVSNIGETTMPHKIPKAYQS